MIALIQFLNEWMITFMFGTLSLTVVLPAIAWIGEELIYGKDAAEMRIYTNFMDSAHRDGHSTQDSLDEILIRAEFVKFRRTASDYVQRDAEHWLDCIEKAKAESIDYLSKTMPRAIPRFIQMSSVGYNHILFQYECDVINRLVKRQLAFNPPQYDQDYAHALRIVKPSRV